MGTAFSTFFARHAEFPIKRPPICFYLPEHFTTTGKLVTPKMLLEQTDQELEEFEILKRGFYDKLIEMRRGTRRRRRIHGTTNVDGILEKFPGWTDMAIENLRSLFILFADADKTLSFQSFCNLLHSLGDESSNEIIKEKFSAYDADSDFTINYGEFLSLVYNFDSTSQATALTGLAKVCVDLADNINFVSSLPVGEQLQYSLF